MLYHQLEHTSFARAELSFNNGQLSKVLIEFYIGSRVVSINKKKKKKKKGK